MFGPTAGALARYRDGKMMMAYADEADGADRTEALLWAAPTGPLPAPPIDTRAQVLPMGDLHWPDAERLFLRLLHTIRPVQYAKLFGVPGQAQAGIDAYARLPLDLAHGETGGRDYITLQSRRVQSLTAARIKKAVDDLLKGEWAKKTAAFTSRFSITAWAIRAVPLPPRRQSVAFPLAARIGDEHAEGEIEADGSPLHE